MPYLPCYYVYKSVIYYTCWVPTICVLNLAIFRCYSILLLRRRRWTGILQRGILGYVLPWLPFLWCYGVFRCSISLIVILVFRDLIYVIIILYSWYLVIYEHFWPYVWNNWSWVMHTMSTQFWHKNRVWQGMYLFLVLTILFTRTSCMRNPIILYLCYMVTRRSGYLSQAFDCTLVKVLHCSLIR
jgi:hypothetical protein